LGGKVLFSQMRKERVTPLKEGGKVEKAVKRIKKGGGCSRGGRGGHRSGEEQTTMGGREKGAVTRTNGNLSGKRLRGGNLYQVGLFTRDGGRGRGKKREVDSRKMR